MKLETAQSLGFDPVTERQLREAFADDRCRGEFVILSRDQTAFIQASGEGDGPYTLEHREGDDDRHFSAGDTFGKADVLRAFLSYLADDDRWKSEFSWQKLDRKPWWKLW